ncbi:MAG TPA: FAD-linked oxidase C-terminal domain-containing protein, partial [Thermoplasmata archaeon]|nr:FAD-linked oxidase C-terminal domain-containing protein [Thermoplasmata archaeon]
EEFAVPLYVYGHLGQGNLHPNFVLDPASGAAGRLRRRLYEETYRLGGTIGAEHGLGIRKRAFLAHEVGGPAVALLQRIKDACDPDGILNPGKLLPDRAPG